MISPLAKEHLRVHACQVIARVPYSHPEGPIYHIVKDLADTDCYPPMCNSVLVNILATSSQVLVSSWGFFPQGFAWNDRHS